MSDAPIVLVTREFLERAAVVQRVRFRTYRIAGEAWRLVRRSHRPVMGKAYVAHRLPEAS